MASSNDEAALKVQALHRGKMSRERVERLLDEARDLDEGLAATAVSDLAPAGESFAFCKLCAGGMQLNGLSGLRTYPHLTSLDVSRNELHCLEALSVLPLLRHLSAASNMLSECLAYVVPNSCLMYADLRGNCIANLRGVAEHHRLETLVLDSNLLRSLEGVTRFSQLRSLRARSNMLRNTGGLVNLPALHELDLSRNTLEAVGELNGIVSLRTVQLSHNRLETLPSLSNLSYLSLLNVQHNNMRGIDFLGTALEHCSALQSLLFSPNPASSTIDDLRLELLHILPFLAEVDAVPVSSVEKVASQNFHSGDASALLTIRHAHLPGEERGVVFSEGYGAGDLACNAADRYQLYQSLVPVKERFNDPLLRLYREQYTARFQSVHGESDLTLLHT